MNGRRRAWIGLAAGAVALVGALAWCTVVLLHQEAEQWRTAHQQRARDQLRLAVWRAEGLIAPPLALEAVRPHFHYQSLYAPELAYAARSDHRLDDAVRLPSPLLTPSVPWIELHFEVDAEGRWSSPQAPPPAMMEQCAVAGLPVDLATRYRTRLTQLASPDAARELAEALDRAAAERGSGFLLAVVDPVSPGVLARNESIEWNARARHYNRQMANNLNSYGNEAAIQPPAVRTSTLVPRWSGDRLLLLRRVQVGARSWTQGVVLDWEVLSAAVSAELADLLPGARLRPITAGGEVPAEGELASIPAAIDPGGLAPPASLGWTPLRAGLALAWLMALLAIATIGLGVIRLLELDQHRLEFVGAVTHELRTPLTTFQMYTDMLANGMVRDPEKMARYHRTLHAESLRLGHMVANVLAYARLEDRRWRPARSVLSVAELFEALRPALEERCQRAGMSLVVGDPGTVQVLADRDAVERILANLVDNACKYAAGSTPAQVVLSVRSEGRHLALGVVDHGPGLDAAQVERVFEPFLRLAGDGVPIPGIGLGLALARRWARQLGGELRAYSGPGGRFELRLLAAGGDRPGGHRADRAVSTTRPSP